MAAEETDNNHICLALNYEIYMSIQKQVLLR